MDDGSVIRALWLRVRNGSRVVWVKLCGSGNRYGWEDRGVVLVNSDASCGVMAFW